MWKGQHGKENNSGHNGKKCTYPHHAPHMPTPSPWSFLGCCIYPGVRITGCLKPLKRGRGSPREHQIEGAEGLPKGWGEKKAGRRNMFPWDQSCFLHPCELHEHDEVIFLHR